MRNPTLSVTLHSQILVILPMSHLTGMRMLELQRLVQLERLLLLELLLLLTLLVTRLPYKCFLGKLG